MTESIVNKRNFCDEERFNWKECFVFVIFPKSRAQAYRNAAVKEKAILSRYSIHNPGRIVGFAYKVQVVEGNWNPKLSVGVFRFATYNDAKMWLESDNEFRQQDFLTNVDIWICPINNDDLTQLGYPIMEIVSQDICFFKDIFMHKYLPNEEASTINHNGHPFVINHDKPYCWRGVLPPGHTIVNQFTSVMNFERYLAADEYRTLENYRKFTGNGFLIMAEMETEL